LAASTIAPTTLGSTIVALEVLQRNVGRLKMAIGSSTIALVLTESWERITSSTMSDYKVDVEANP
jgi:hypothetical protein